MNNRNNWTNGTDYLITVYSTTAIEPIGSVPFYLFVGDAVTGSSISSSDLLSLANVTWIGNQMRINYSINALNQTPAVNHPNTSRVSQISLRGSSSMALSNWSFTASRAGRTIVSDSGATLGISASRNANVNELLQGTWMFTFSGTVPNVQGNSKPSVHFQISYEIGG